MEIFLLLRPVHVPQNHPQIAFKLTYSRHCVHRQQHQQQQCKLYVLHPRTEEVLESPLEKDNFNHTE